MLDADVLEAGGADERQLQVDTGEDFTDADALEEPVAADFLHFFRDLRIVNTSLVLISDDHLTIRVLLGQLLHATIYQLSKLIEDICEQDELLRVEEWCGHIVQQLGAHDSDSDTADLVLLIPELREFLVDALELLGDLLGTHERVFLTGGFRVKLIEPRLALSHPNLLVNSLLWLLLAVANLDRRSFRVLTEHGKNPDFLLLPCLEVKLSLALHLVELGQRIIRISPLIKALLFLVLPLLVTLVVGASIQHKALLLLPEGCLVLLSAHVGEGVVARWAQLHVVLKVFQFIVALGNGSVRQSYRTYLRGTYKATWLMLI